MKIREKVEMELRIAETMEIEVRKRIQELLPKENVSDIKIDLLYNMAKEYHDKITLLNDILTYED